MLWPTDKWIVTSIGKLAERALLVVAVLLGMGVSATQLSYALCKRSCFQGAIWWNFRESVQVRNDWKTSEGVCINLARDNTPLAEFPNRLCGKPKDIQRWRVLECAPYCAEPGWRGENYPIGQIVNVHDNLEPILCVIHH
jgi:hypothetical protein